MTSCRRGGSERATHRARRQGSATRTPGSLRGRRPDPGRTRRKDPFVAVAHLVRFVTCPRDSDLLGESYGTGKPPFNHHPQSRVPISTDRRGRPDQLLPHPRRLYAARRRESHGRQADIDSQRDALVLVRLEHTCRCLFNGEAMVEPVLNLTCQTPIQTR